MTVFKQFMLISMMIDLGVIICCHSNCVMLTSAIAVSTLKRISVYIADRSALERKCLKRTFQNELGEPDASVNVVCLYGWTLELKKRGKSKELK